MMFVTDNYQLVVLAEEQSMAADFTTNYHDLRTFDIMSLQFVWTNANGTTLGPAKVWVEGSLDGVNWCNVFPDTSVKRVTSANGCLMYTFDAVGWIYQRVFFEHRACTQGTCTIYSFGKRRRSNNP